jgi:hypothetical protein
MGAASTATPRLSFDQRQILIGLELLSHGSTASLSPLAGRGGETAQVLPTGESAPPHLRYVDALRVPGADVESIMAEASAELDAWKRRPLTAPTAVETLDDLKGRIVECAGWAPAQVALAMRCTESLVRVARVEGGLDPEYGDPLSEPLPVDARERARALVELGLSYRQAEAISGVPATTIWRAGRAT